MIFSVIFFAGINDTKKIIKKITYKNSDTFIPKYSKIKIGEKTKTIQIFIAIAHQKYLINSDSSQFPYYFFS